MDSPLSLALIRRRSHSRRPFARPLGRVARLCLECQVAPASPGRRGRTSPACVSRLAKEIKANSRLSRGRHFPAKPKTARPPLQVALNPMRLLPLDIPQRAASFAMLCSNLIDGLRPGRSAKGLSRFGCVACRPAVASRGAARRGHLISDGSLARARAREAEPAR